MFTELGPSLRELAVQALSSVEHGYDLLAPKFDHTPFRTSDRILDEVAGALRPLGPFEAGLDLCCGTGAGVEVLRRAGARRVTGVDFSAGMLRLAQAAQPEGAAVDWVRADVRRLAFAGEFDVAVSFGAFGHFLPGERPALFARVHAALRPGGRFVFPIAGPPPVGSGLYWLLWAFDAGMRVRNAVWRPPFVMYYRTFRLADVRAELARAGFAVRTQELPGLGRLPGGAPRCRLVVADRG